jgi:hypothetical protein
MNRSIQSAITIVPRDGVDVGHASTGGVSWHGRRDVPGLRIAAADRDIWNLLDPETYLPDAGGQVPISQAGFPDRLVVRVG